MWGAKGPLRDDDGRKRLKKGRENDAILVRVSPSERAEVRFVADELKTTFTDAVIRAVFELGARLRQSKNEGGQAAG